MLQRGVTMQIQEVALWGRISTQLVGILRDVVEQHISPIQKVYKPNLSRSIEGLHREKVEDFAFQWRSDICQTSQYSGDLGRGFG
jgi:hypothetical protein